MTFYTRVSASCAEISKQTPSSWKLTLEVSKEDWKEYDYIVNEKMHEQKLFDEAKHAGIAGSHSNVTVCGEISAEGGYVCVAWWEATSGLAPRCCDDTFI
jgi:hypothetical protein